MSSKSSSNAMEGVVISSPKTVMEMPWPAHTEQLFLSGMRDLPPEEMERLQSEETFQESEYRRMRQELLMAKRAACPTFSLSLRSDKPVASNSKFYIEAALRYESSPNEDASPVVLETPSNAFKDIRYGGYHAFTHSSCDPSSQVKFHKKYVTMRPARGPDGKILPPPPEDPLAEENGWVEMRPGDEKSFDIIIDFNSNGGWKDSIRIGNDYWLKYGVPRGMSVGKPEIPNWRFGTMKEWEGEIASRRDNTYVPIPLGPSNALKFHVSSVEED